MEKGWRRLMVRYPVVVLVEQGRLTQRQAAQEMGLSVRQVRRVLRRYRESGGRLESPPLAGPVRLHLDACHQQASSPIGVTDEFGHHGPSTKQAKKRH
jgi:transposase